MTRPRKTLSIESSTQVESGNSVELSGRTAVSLFAVSDDPTGVEIEVHASLDGENFAPIKRTPPDGQILTLDDSDFTDGNAIAVNHHVPAEEIRAEIISAPSGSTDVWIGVSSTPEAGYEFREVE